MTNYKEMEQKVQEVYEQMQSYKDKPTKAANKRIRKNLTALKHLVVPARKDLLEQEKTM